MPQCIGARSGVRLFSLKAKTARDKLCWGPYVLICDSMLREGKENCTMMSFMNAVLESVFSKAPSSEAAENPPPSIDTVTGLLTRTGLMNAATRVLSRSGQTSHSYAAISVDLDKDNAGGGLLASDLVIKEVSLRIRSTVRSEDLVARTEDNEFVILMPSISSEIAILNISDRVLSAVSQPIIEENVQIYPSLTIGISTSNDDGNQVFEEVLYRSDLALKQAKLICRGAVHFFDSSIAADVDRRKAIERDLRVAVSNNELRLHYQPIYDIKNSVISHIEALVRWQHPELGLVPPMDFIPVAEASGTIQSIGAWVLQQAFADLHVLDDNGLEQINITVNLSPEQLKLSKIVKMIEQTGGAAVVHRGRVALEVTEDTILDERYQMGSKLQDLRKLGFQIFLDDFGTGNASIGRLRNANFDAIKIDRSLITNIEQNDADLAIVRSILYLAASLNLTVVAEGVETAACCHLLASENCRYAQGYYFSKPLPLPDIIEVIQQRFEMSNLAKALTSI